MAEHERPQGEKTAEMRRRWNQLARESPLHYIDSSRKDWSEEQFIASARGITDKVMATIGDRLGRTAALEIGCGVGRNLYHLASEFERVHGVDISTEMIEQAKRMGHLPDNVHLSTTPGAELDEFDDGTFDLVLSSHVFQHIADPGIISRYVAETARVLAPDGLAWLHFDTRRRSIARALMGAVPDPLLPRLKRRHIRRYRLPREEPSKMAAAAGLEVVQELEPGTALHVTVLGHPR